MSDPAVPVAGLTWAALEEVYRQRPCTRRRRFPTVRTSERSGSFRHMVAETLHTFHRTHLTVTLSHTAAKSTAVAMTLSIPNALGSN